MRRCLFRTIVLLVLESPVALAPAGGGCQPSPAPDCQGCHADAECGSPSLRCVRCQCLLAPRPLDGGLPDLLLDCVPPCPIGSHCVPGRCVPDGPLDLR